MILDALAQARASSRTERKSPVIIEVGPEVFTYSRGELTDYVHRERFTKALASNREHVVADERSGL